jgi:hypothetical protein
MIYGYARVSTDGQSVDAQVKQLRAAGAEKVFRETASLPTSCQASRVVGVCEDRPQSWVQNGSPSGVPSHRKPRCRVPLANPRRQIQLNAVYIKKLTGVLRELATYVSGQYDSIINYAAARRSGEPISTAQTESAVHRLLHRRMTAKQQMRWSPRGAHFVLKGRTSVMNRTFERGHIALTKSMRCQQRRAA